MWTSIGAEFVARFFGSTKGSNGSCTGHHQDSLTDSAFHSEPAHFDRREVTTDLDKPTNPTDDPKGTLHTTAFDEIPEPATVANIKTTCEHTSRPSRPAHRSTTYRRTRCQQSQRLHTFSEWTRRGEGSHWGSRDCGGGTGTGIGTLFIRGTEANNF